MIFGYARVSTKGQNLDRQLAELKEFGVPDKNVFTDKESGKDFGRQNYLRLRRRLKEGDLLVVKSIDRLGRNYSMILEEWGYITKTAKCDVVVLDMNLLDTRARDSDLMGKFIADLVLQILSFVAENERMSIRERQAEGIRIAKEKGVKFGRPQAELAESVPEAFALYLAKELTRAEALQKTNLKRTTFYKYYNRFLAENAKEKGAAASLEAAAPPYSDKF